MGCCASTKKPGANKPNGLRRLMSHTGIMDEEAPSTTAPKLDLKREGVEEIIVKLVDVMQGEQLVINDRIPVEDRDSRLFLYEQLLLTMREVAHVLNEQFFLGVKQLPPSQVMDLIAAARNRATPIGPVEIPVPTVRKAPPSPVFKKRAELMTEWIKISVKTETDDLKSPEIPYLSMMKYHATVKFCTPVHQIVMDKPTANTYSYMDLCHSSIIYENKKLANIREVYKQACPSGMMTAKELAAGAKIDVTVAKKTFHDVLVDQDLLTKQSNHWSFREFCMYLLGSRNSILSPEKTETVYQNMNLPIQNYIINTSTCSWLINRDQLTSDSSVDMLKNILLEGCRAIELDCNDGDNGEPTVRLSWTKNKPLLLKDCLEAIAETAFETTEYPLILSLRLHFGAQPDARLQMEKSAGYITKYLGPYLASWKDSLEPPEPATATPNGLKKKILIESEKRWHEIAKPLRDRERSHSHNGVVANNTATPTSPTLTVDLGIMVSNIKANIGVKIVAVAENSPVQLAGITEGMFIEAVGTTKVATAEQLRAALGSGQTDEIRLTVDQREVKVIITKEEPTPKICSAPVPANSPVIPPDLDGNHFPTQSSFNDDGGLNDSTDDEKPEILRKCKATEILARQKAGGRYKKLPVSKELSSLAFLKKSVKRSITRSGQWWETLNTTTKSVEDSDPSLLNEISSTQIIHINPPRSALSSENIPPCALWDNGVQMVGAFHHSPDENLELQKAQFLDNGRAGWVQKKPFFPDGAKLDFSIQVHCLTQLPYSLGDDVEGYFVKCRVNSEEFGETGPSEYCSWDKTIEVKIALQARQFLTLSVCCESRPSNIVARSIIPVHLLRGGLRCFPVSFPDSLEAAEAKLLCTVDIRE